MMIIQVLICLPRASVMVRMLQPENYLEIVDDARDEILRNVNLAEADLKSQLIKLTFVNRSTPDKNFEESFLVS